MDNDEKIMLDGGRSAPAMIPYMPAGVHLISATVNGNPGRRRVVVTEAACARLQSDLEQMQSEVKAHRRARPAVYFDHKTGAAAAYPKRFVWGGDDKGIMLELEEWSHAGRAAVEGRDYGYVSPAFRMDRATGEVTGLLGGVEVCSLVNDPAFERIDPIMDVVAASRAYDYPVGGEGEDEVNGSNPAGCNQHGHGFAGDCGQGFGSGGQRTFGFVNETVDKGSATAKAKETRDGLISAAAKASDEHRKAYKEFDSIIKKMRGLRYGSPEHEALSDALDKAEKAVDEAYTKREAAKKALRDYDVEESRKKLDAAPKHGQDKTQAAKTLPPRGEVENGGESPQNEATATGGGNSNQNKSMDENKKMNEKLGLPEDADDAARLAALDKKAEEAKKQKEEVEALRAELNKKEDELKAMRADNAQKRVDALIERGIIGAKEEERITAAKNMAMNDPAGFDAVFASMSAAPGKGTDMILGGKAQGGSGKPASNADALQAEMTPFI